MCHWQPLNYETSHFSMVRKLHFYLFVGYHNSILPMVCLKVCLKKSPKFWLHQSEGPTAGCDRRLFQIAPMRVCSVKLGFEHLGIWGKVCPRRQEASAHIKCNQRHSYRICKLCDSEYQHRQTCLNESPVVFVWATAKKEFLVPPPYGGRNISIPDCPNF